MSEPGLQPLQAPSGADLACTACRKAGLEGPSAAHRRQASRCLLGPVETGTPRHFDQEAHGPSHDEKRSDPPLIQEEGAPWREVAANADLDLPEPRLEQLPVVLISLLGLGALQRQPLEDEVLDQVRRGERCPSSVEGLEYLLGVLVSPKLDDDELQSVCQNLRYLLATALYLVFTSGFDPLTDDCREISVRLRETAVAVFEIVVGNGYLSSHDLVVCGSVPVGRPHLELVFVISAEVVGVKGHALESTR